VSPAALGVALLAVFVAALTKGYSGFWFNLVAVAGLSLVLAPSDAVPIVFVLAAVSSVHLVPQVWREADWGSVWLLLGVAMAATPVGVAVLRRVPAAPMRVAISVMVLAAAALLWSGIVRRRPPGAASAIAVGVTSGLLNGSVGVAGPPVILFYFSSFATLAIARASLIAYFLGTDATAVASAALQGMLTPDVLSWCAVLLPSLVLGITLGARGFVRAPQATARRVLVVLLVLLGLGGLLRGLRELAGA
jgi:uncharacterized membrane protein YfcA